MSTILLTNEDKEQLQKSISALETKTNEALTDYVRKIEEATGVTVAEVYTNKFNNVTQRNTNQLDVYNTANKYAIPIRNSLGGIYIPDAGVKDDGVIPSGQVAVNRNYVDDLVGDIETALDNIIAIQESLIGGESA